MGYKIHKIIIIIDVEHQKLQTMNEEKRISYFVSVSIMSRPHAHPATFARSTSVVCIGFVKMPDRKSGKNEKCLKYNSILEFRLLHIYVLVIMIYNLV